MISLDRLHAYNALPRGAELQSRKYLGIAYIKTLLRGPDNQRQRGIKILANLVKFKFQRDAHLPLFRNRQQEQEQELSELESACGNRQGGTYDAVLALARNRGTGGLLRDLPSQLVALLNGLDHATQVTLLVTLDDEPGVRNFLRNAGVNLASDVDDTDDSDHLSRASSLDDDDVSLHLDTEYDEVASPKQKLDNLLWNHFTETGPVMRSPLHINQEEQQAIQRAFRLYMLNTELTESQNALLTRHGAEVIHACIMDDIPSI